MDMTMFMWIFFLVAIILVAATTVVLILYKDNCRKELEEAPTMEVRVSKITALKNTNKDLEKKYKTVSPE